MSTLTPTRRCPGENSSEAERATPPRGARAGTERRRLLADHPSGPAWVSVVKLQRMMLRSNRDLRTSA